MGAIKITIVGTEYNPVAAGPASGTPVTIVGEAYLTDVGVGGGPIIPPAAPPGHVSLPIWGPGWTPPGQEIPGGPPVAGWTPPGYQPGGGPIIPLPPPPYPDPPSPPMVKPPPPEGGWGYHPDLGWGYFPGPGQPSPKG